MSESAAQFALRLDALGAPFELIGDLHPTRAEVRFVGEFEGENLIWELELNTLAGWRERYEPDQQRNLMLIEAPYKGRCRVRLGLQIPAVSEAHILMAMRMLRQYKRLSRGRHEWGGADSPTPELSR